MKKVSMIGDWNYLNAGGCGKFGTFEKNPAYAFNIVEESDVQVRLRVTEETMPDGVTVIKDFEHFTFCVNLMVYRVQQSRWPPAPGSI